MTAEFYDLLQEFGAALVIADTAGKYPCVERLTTDFMYVRLHGSTRLYASNYTDAELDLWAERIATWADGGRDVHVYFDNDALAHAPRNARDLASRLTGTANSICGV